MIEKIEDYRVRHGMSKADMARRFNVEMQNYNNWTYRGSLPKKHFATALELLAANSSASEDEFRSLLSQTTRDQDMDAVRELAAKSSAPEAIEIVKIFLARLEAEISKPR